MPTENQMSVNERRKYLTIMKPRYQAAGRAERSLLLSEMEQVTGLHRKHLTRLLNAESLKRKTREKQRERSSGPEVERVILKVWESLDYICAERLTPSLLPTAQHLARFEVVRLNVDLQEQLAQISRATVARLLSHHRSQKTRLPRKGPERANQVSKGVPMKRIPWDTQEPGHFEVDLVHHCGELSVGEYAHTLQMIDVATGWSERVVVCGRGQRAMEAGFRQILERLPFEVRELHPDNGTEFFNHHLVRFWKEKVVGVTLSRSRPYQKNDNRYVEQKNDSLVRQYLGYGRLDTKEQVKAANDLYERMWVYYNLFQPVLHLCEKVSQGDRVRRKWDQAQTPFERLKATGMLAPAHQDRLQTLYEQTNPLALRQEIYQRLAALWDESLASSIPAA